MNINSTIKALEKKHYKVSYFATSEEAACYLDNQIDGKTVGFGDSYTLDNLNLYERLSKHNKVYDPNQCQDNDGFLQIAKKCLTADVFLTSVNGMSETGEMVNIDGTGNRIAGSLFCHDTVYFVIGTNKIRPTLDDAIYRARNIAAPHNAKRLGLSTPCAMADNKRCYNCNSSDRICNALTIYYRKMNDIDNVEIILIDEALGY